MEAEKFLRDLIARNKAGNVVDQFWESALFQDFGSAPSTISADKFLDYYSCCL